MQVDADGPGGPRLLKFIALFDAEQFFTAHEVLEELWSVTQGSEKTLYQGLIQAAVALHHRAHGEGDGARTMLRRACAKLEPFRDMAQPVDVGRLIVELTRCVESDGPVPKLRAAN